jgi:beta-carotene hydroxylase
VTYGSTSHDLVHRNLGLSRRANEIFLTLIELLSLRSGHAYRMAHLHHHARFPAEDDIEAAASKRSLGGALLEGVTFHFRLWRWALKRAREGERRLILIEGRLVLLLILTSILVCQLTLVPLVYVLLMTAGAWITPLVTSYVPHNPHGKSELEQTRVFRGVAFSVLALEHLYHLEHHLYPSVPHQNWPALARRLDPYLKEQGITPIKSWF